MPDPHGNFVERIEAGLVSSVEAAAMCDLEVDGRKGLPMISYHFGGWVGFIAASNTIVDRSVHMSAGGAVLSTKAHHSKPPDMQAEPVLAAPEPS